MRLHIPFAETVRIIGAIPHTIIFEENINDHWVPFHIPSNGTNGAHGVMRAQAVCWLYCWAMTGMNIHDVMAQSQFAFNQIFEIPFERYPQEINGEFHQWARRIRYMNGDYESELTERLGV